MLTISMAQRQEASESKTTHVRINRDDKSRLGEAKDSARSWPDMMGEIVDEYLNG